MLKVMTDAATLLLTCVATKPASAGDLAESVGVDQRKLVKQLMIGRLRHK